MLRRFVLKSLLYISILLALHYLAAWRADGVTDPYYLRFANGRHRSLILGTSRAAQGLIPTVMNEELGVGYSEIGNFSFTLAQSPYGPVYLQSIRKKLDASSGGQKNVFILSIDPWSLCNQNNPEDDPAHFRENKRILGKIKNVSVEGRPNFEYLLKSFTKAWGSLLYRWKISMEIHPDGWLEVKIPMDSGAVERRTTARIRAYREDVFPYYTFSPIRYEYLRRTADWLQNHGEVYLIRLPVHPGILNLEEKLIPDFKEKICALIQGRRIPYWDFTTKADQFTYTDGNHLYRESARDVSRIIAKHIRTGFASDCKCEQ